MTDLGDFTKFMDVIRDHCASLARSEAERTDAEGRDLLACGYTVEELRWVWRRVEDENGVIWYRSEVLPASMVE